MGSLPSKDMVAPIYIAKYNRFVDTIMERINRVLRRSYDPVNVRLQNAQDAKKTANKTKTNKTKSKKRQHPGQKANNDLNETNVTTTAVPDDTTTILTTEKSLSNDIPTRNSTDKPEPRGDERLQRANNNNNKKKQNKNKKKNKNTKPKNQQRAKATLYGLSTLKRDGDVSVNVMSSHTTVKTKFLIGPLVLKVEKEFGRGAKKELRSATATTAEMYGKLNLRVLHGGAATLHSIKVLQPRQVRVDSIDDHDRTREFVWRRSSHIAHLVSQKLLRATRSMLKPAPKPNNK